MNRTSNLVVQKFGGTSVGTIARIKAVAEHVVKTGKREGVVVVISAMGDQTDDLLALAAEVNPNMPVQFRDQVVQTGEVVAAGLLAGAIDQLEAKVVMLNSHQVRMEASPAAPGQALLQRIAGVNLIKRHLRAGSIVVIPGFQGVTDDEQIVTLGRGGSDVSAVALAGVLKAARCEKYTDVDGLSPVHPKYVPNADRLRRISYEQALVLASGGVLLDRSIELARDLGVVLVVKLSPSIGRSDGGTIITAGARLDALEGTGRDFTAIAVHTNVALVEVPRVPNQPGWAAKIFGAVEDLMIGDAIQGKGGAHATISFLVEAKDLDLAIARIQLVLRRAAIGKGRARKRYNVARVRGRAGIAGLTLFDPRMRRRSGFMAKVTRTLAKARVNIDMISTSDAGILIVFQARMLKRAARALARAFDLCQVRRTIKSGPA